MCSLNSAGTINSWALRGARARARSSRTRDGRGEGSRYSIYARARIHVSVRSRAHPALPTSFRFWVTAAIRLAGLAATPRAPAVRRSRSMSETHIDATWRLGKVTSHLLSAHAAEHGEQGQPYNGGFIVTSLLEAPRTKTDAQASQKISTLQGGELDDQQLAEYIARGFINLSPEWIGLDADHHRRVHAHHRAGRLAHGTAGHPYASHAATTFSTTWMLIREFSGHQLIALVAAVGSILGPNWAIVPYANSVIEADVGDQHWYDASF